MFTLDAAGFIHREVPQRVVQARQYLLFWILSAPESRLGDVCGSKRAVASAAEAKLHRISDLAVVKLSPLQFESAAVDGNSLAEVLRNCRYFKVENIYDMPAFLECPLDGNGVQFFIVTNHQDVHVKNSDVFERRLIG